MEIFLLPRLSLWDFIRRLGAQNILINFQHLSVEHFFIGQISMYFGSCLGKHFHFVQAKFSQLLYLLILSAHIQILDMFF